MMTFQLTNDKGEVVLAAESDATWNTIGTTRYTVGDMLMLGWNLTEKYKPKASLIFTQSRGCMIHSFFQSAAHHYKLKYSGSPSEGITDVVRLPGDPDPNWRPMRPVHTGKVFPDELGPNAMKRPSKERVFILETKDGREVLRATLGMGRRHELVEVMYEGDTSVILWSGSPAQPCWVYTFFKDAYHFGGLNFPTLDKDDEPYATKLPPGWSMEYVDE
ncbi:MAG: hypothetical protein OJI67_19950 [Prosthecobacter sp.]|nr:hypothetical protein [Prosthecobacter sp.]